MVPLYYFRAQHSVLLTTQQSLPSSMNRELHLHLTAFILAHLIFYLLHFWSGAHYISALVCRGQTTNTFLRRIIEIFYIQSRKEKDLPGDTDPPFCTSFLGRRDIAPPSLSPTPPVLIYGSWEYP